MHTSAKISPEKRNRVAHHTSLETDGLNGTCQLVDNRPEEFLQGKFTNKVVPIQCQTRQLQTRQLQTRQLQTSAENSGSRALQAKLQAYKANETHMPTIQRASKLWKKIKAALSIKSVALGIEGIGHVTLGILSVLAGAGAITSVALAPVGTLAIVGGVGQIIIGVSKWIRAAILGHANSSDDGKPSPGQKAAMSFLTALDASISIATAVGGAIAASSVIALIAKIVSIVGGGLKYIRGLITMFGGLKKKAGWIVAAEAILGGLSSLAGVLESGGAAIMGAIGYIVNLVKSFRGGATAAEAAYPDEQPPVGGQQPENGV